MSSPIVSLGNGAWVAKNTTLSSSYNANDDQNGGWTPQQPSGSDAYATPTIDFDGIDESSSSLQAYGGSEDGYSLTWNAYIAIEESGSYVFHTSSDDGVVLTVQDVDRDGDIFSTTLASISDWENSGGWSE